MKPNLIFQFRRKPAPKPNLATGESVSHLQSQALDAYKLLEADSKVDLSGYNLSNCDFSHFNLISVQLNGSNLSHSRLNCASLKEAQLRGARLIEAELCGADLQDANLNGADLRRSDLRRSDLNGADLRRSDLNGADLRRADLSGADLRRADLHRADLRNTYLSDTNLSDVNVQGALFQDCIGLTEDTKCDLRRRGAIFHYSDSRVVDIRWLVQYIIVPITVAFIGGSGIVGILKYLESEHTSPPVHITPSPFRNQRFLSSKLTSTTKNIDSTDNK